MANNPSRSPYRSAIEALEARIPIMEARLLLLEEQMKHVATQAQCAELSEQLRELRERFGVNEEPLVRFFPVKPEEQPNAD